MSKPSSFPAQTKPFPAKPLPYKRFSPDEMSARREKGLCFNCDDKLFPGHKCKPPLFQCILAEEEEPETPEEPDLSQLQLLEIPAPKEPGDSPKISLFALEGHKSPATLCLAAKLQGRDVVILIDGGSTHNFMQTRLAASLGLPIHKSTHLNVTVGNGDSIKCDGVCHDVKMLIQKEPFSFDLYLLPIFGANIVLGVQWHSTLGPITFDYKELYMEFQQAGKPVRLEGVKQGTLSAISLSQLRTSNLSTDTATFFYLSISHTPPTNTLVIHTAPTPALNTALRSLLNDFALVF